MKCNVCKRDISKGGDLPKAIAQYQQADGSIKTYGWDREDGRLPQFGGVPTGRLVRTFHYKAVPVSVRVLTPHGWVAAGALSEGDEVVCGAGGTTKIDVVHDYEPRPVWSVLLRDGSTARADAEHLWQTDRGLVETRDLVPGDALPWVGDYDGCHEPEFDPYAVGCLLGDGYIPTWYVTTADEDLAAELHRRLPLTYERRTQITPAGTQMIHVCMNRYKESIRQILPPWKGVEKRVPEVVFSWPRQARLDVLRGLMDTDGSVSAASGQYLFVSKSERLAQGVRDLSRSLGGTARLYRTGAGYFMVSVAVFDNPFLLPRKADQWKPPTKVRRKVEATVETAEIEAMVCFTLADESGLFVVDDFVVTHNCFMVMTKKVTREENQQEGASGRLASFTPSAYEVTALTANQDEIKMLGLTPEQVATMNTATLSARIQEARTRAMADGYGADDWVFQERAKAENHGGQPYAHKHDPRAIMQDGLLRPHLHYAHGVEDPMEMGGPTMRKMAHNEMHAIMAAQAIRESREQDPGYTPPGESDWRDQTVVEVAHTPRVASAESLTPVPGSSGETMSVGDL